MWTLYARSEAQACRGSGSTSTLQSTSSHSCNSVVQPSMRLLLDRTLVPVLSSSSARGVMRSTQRCGLGCPPPRRVPTATYGQHAAQARMRVHMPNVLRAYVVHDAGRRGRGGFALRCTCRSSDLRRIDTPCTLALAQAREGCACSIPRRPRRLWQPGAKRLAYCCGFSGWCFVLHGATQTRAAMRREPFPHKHFAIAGHVMLPP